MVSRRLGSLAIALAVGLGASHAAGARAQSASVCPGGQPLPPVQPAVVPEPPRPGFHRHDGFMARLTLGFGSARVSAQGRDAAGSLERIESGFAGTLSLDIGGTPVENLIVHGRLAGQTVASPELELDGRNYGRARGASAGSNLLGAGVTYYLMPLGLYATGVLGLAWFTFEDVDGNALHSRVGFGLNADVGKEWWISADVGIGLGVRLWYARAKQQNDELGLHVTDEQLGWGILASFTWQ